MPPLSYDIEEVVPVSTIPHGAPFLGYALTHAIGCPIERRQPLDARAGVWVASFLARLRFCLSANRSDADNNPERCGKFRLRAFCIE